MIDNDIYIATCKDAKEQALPEESAWLREPEHVKDWSAALVDFKKELEAQLSAIPRHRREARADVVRVLRGCEARIAEAKGLLREAGDDLPSLVERACVALERIATALESLDGTTLAAAQGTVNAILRRDSE